MKNVITLLWITLILVLPLSGNELPLSESVEIKTYNDQYSQVFLLPVLVKKGTTYEIEDRMVHLHIGPQKFRAYQEKNKIYEDKDYFLKVLVSVVLTDAEENVSEEFESYLNFEYCEDSEGRLFWDHAGEERADRAGQTFDQDHPLTVEDAYLKVTVNVTGFASSLYSCIPGYDLYCTSDSDCLFYMDFLTLQIVVDYASAQEEINSLFEDASEHAGFAAALFERGEFEKARDEYQDAKGIYDQLGDVERSDDVQEQIDTCTSYIDGYEYFSDGMRTFEKAKGTGDYKEAIQKYEEAQSHFETAQAEFDEVDDTAQYDECQLWIDRCTDEIDNLKEVGTLRTRLTIIIIAIAVLVGGGLVIKQVGKRKAEEAEEGFTLRVQNAETEEVATIRVNEFDKIGKVRQLAGTKLGIMPSEMLFREKACLPDKTVEECGLREGAVAVIVPLGKEVKLKPKLEPKLEVPPQEKPELREALEVTPPSEAKPEKEPRIILKDQVISISKSLMTIGRGESADIHIPDPERLVSRIHARVYRDERGQYWIEDNNSKNGTFIYKDGEYKKIKKWALHDGDTIVLCYDPEGEGEVTLTFQGRGRPEREMDRKTRIARAEMKFKAELIIQGKPHQLIKEITTIGRGESADIHIPDPERLVSRIHARVYRDERGQYWIEDNNSKNGTFIYKDGEYKKIKKWALYHGDTIGLAYDPSTGPQITLQFKKSRQ
ncbi:MAG: FHA domain-containing protein [Theionarchaea archaeon]|nr:FHA domain-containing protein [Theionarchaea archaeon]